jgi:hypothetical protein
VNRRILALEVIGVLYSDNELEISEDVINDPWLRWQGCGIL